jgi:hypothetical protein
MMPLAKTRPKKPFQVVYTVVERRGRKWWVRIGAAFRNADGSTNVVLDAAPLNGELQIRDYRPPEETAAEAPDPGEPTGRPRSAQG